MSKARNWAAAKPEGFKFKINEHRLTDASVSDCGGFILSSYYGFGGSRSISFAPEEIPAALALARWILDTFGEDNS